MSLLSEFMEEVILEKDDENVSEMQELVEQDSAESTGGDVDASVGEHVAGDVTENVEENTDEKVAEKSTENIPTVLQDVTEVELADGRQISLIGTAHISKESVDTVLKYLSESHPDTVCIELDEQRHQAIRSKVNWEDFDLIQILREKKMTFFIAKLALSSFQKNMSNYTGVKPGSEMVAAMNCAEEISAKVELIDRNISTTLLRAWRLTPFFQKTKLVAALVASVFQKSEVDEVDLAELRQSANLSDMMEELGKEIPYAKRALLDERDAYMSEKIMETTGKHIVVVIGAAHKAGIERRLRSGERSNLADLDEVPKKSMAGKLIPWILPLLIIAVFILGFVYGDTEKAKTAVYAWFIVNGIGGGLGALLALGHPITILTAIVAAPITSLNPTIGVGMVAGIVQTYFVPPKVSDFERIGDDLGSLKTLWKNRLGRVLLVFILSSLGSSIATFVSFKWLVPLFG